MSTMRFSLRAFIRNIAYSEPRKMGRNDHDPDNDVDRDQSQRVIAR